MTDLSAKENQVMLLPDGRRLGFAEYGASGGAPVFYFHGWPSSRFEARAADPVVADLGVRLIAPDRPGYGLSDFQPGRAIVDWPVQVAALADHLGLEEFGVLGVSGGGPYAAACASVIPQRLTSVSLVCSAGPFDVPGALEGMVPLMRWLLNFFRTNPWLAQKTAGVYLRAIWGKGERAVPRQIEERLPASDKKALENPDLRAALIASSKEAMRHGLAAAGWDGFLLAGPWGFRLENIRTRVRLWHGEKDIVVPPTLGRYLAQTIPKCEGRFYPEEGHFSLPFTRLQEIIRAARSG